jgi:hypothetical protein
VSVLLSFCLCVCLSVCVSPEACTIKHIAAVIYGFRNKLECLSKHTGRKTEGQTQTHALPSIYGWVKNFNALVWYLLLHYVCFAHSVHEDKAHSLLKWSYEVLKRVFWTSSVSFSFQNVPIGRNFFLISKFERKFVIIAPKLVRDLYYKTYYSCN